MPTETFFNLPEEKRNKIIKAAKDEFTENILLKSRVSNIIKAAGIPRGSFYQYFEDLEDLFYYVVDEVFEDFFVQGTSFTEEVRDIFDFAIYSFQFDYDAYANENRHRFMKNVLRSMSDNEEYIEKHNERRIQYIENNLAKMDLSNLRFTERDDLIKMYELLQDVKRNIIMKSLWENVSKEEATKEIAWYVDVLKKGLLKEE